jgi:hypothetical protein
MEAAAHGPQWQQGGNSAAPIALIAWPIGVAGPGAGHCDSGIAAKSMPGVKSGAARRPLSPHTIFPKNLPVQNFFVCPAFAVVGMAQMGPRTFSVMLAAYLSGYSTE